MTASKQSDLVFEALYQDILACILKPSQKIKIGEITVKYNVSPGAAREALSRLVSEGIVVASPQRGFSVAPISHKELSDLTEARVVLETQCLRLAIENGGIEWETEIVSAHYRLSLISESVKSAPAKLSPAWSQAHSQFHAALVSACGNDCLLELRALLYARSERYRHWSVSLSDLPLRDRDVAAEHETLKNAVLARDIPNATKLAAAHFRRTSDELIHAAQQSKREIV